MQKRGKSYYVLEFEFNQRIQLSIFTSEVNTLTKPYNLRRRCFVSSNGLGCLKDEAPSVDT